MTLELSIKVGNQSKTVLTALGRGVSAQPEQKNLGLGEPSIEVEGRSRLVPAGTAGKRRTKLGPADQSARAARGSV